MSDTKKVEDALSELEKQATIDAEQFFPSVTVDKLKVTKKEVNGPFAFITVQSPKAKVTLRYAWRTKQLLGTV